MDFSTLDLINDEFQSKKYDVMELNFNIRVIFIARNEGNIQILRPVTAQLNATRVSFIPTYVCY